MSARLERALADLVGGFDGGLSLWEVACRKLERAAAAHATEEHRFRTYPGGALNRLLVDIEDCLRVATLAVELQATLDQEPDARGKEREATIAALLLDRARELADARSGQVPS